MFEKKNVFSFETLIGSKFVKSIYKISVLVRFYSRQPSSGNSYRIFWNSGWLNPVKIREFQKNNLTCRFASTDAITYFHMEVVVLLKLLTVLVTNPTR